MKALALALVVLLPTVASAEERSTTITLGGQAGAQRTDKPSPDDSRGIGGARLTLSWDTPPLTYPDAPGYAWGGALVPELYGGMLLDAIHGEGYLGAGVRAELKMAQFQTGLLKVSMRGSTYLAARGMVIGNNRDGAFEFALGTYFYVGRQLKIGLEGAALLRTQDSSRSEAAFDSTHVGGTAIAYVGWTL